MRDAIIFEHVRFCYGDVCAVGNVDFCVKEKTLTALVGPNGGGKSTLLKLLAGVLRPEEGRVKKCGDVAYVPQSVFFDTSFPITVRELVMMGTLRQDIRPFCRYGSAGKKAAGDAIARAGLTGYEHRGVGQLSGGQLGRAVIARALASDADIIALDEPDASLDIDAALKLYALLETLKKDRTIVVASHRIDAILSLADSAVYVNKDVKAYASPGRLKDELRGGVCL
ncbi:MAG: metal ABC transporter ATP-binding protein [Eubacteriales bacterium]|nr:metal ABC transporter ATP-binding protein [Eubacteriales bacterium]